MRGSHAVPNSNLVILVCAQNVLNTHRPIFSSLKLTQGHGHLDQRICLPVVCAALREHFTALHSRDELFRGMVEAARVLLEILLKS
jgi:hypothetical protein